MKEIFAPHLSRNVKLGRKRPVAHCPHMRLSRYLKGAALPQAPATCDYSPNAASLRNVYLNDQLGDCVIAGGYHIVGTETGNAGDPFVATDQQLVADYGAVGGYVPGDPSTDNGCDLQTAMNYWTQHGFADGTKLAGWLAVNAADQQEVMQALYLFENLYFGIELPNSWISPFPSGDGFVWDAGSPDQNNGHCIVGVGYDTSGVKVDSWGLLGTLTWAAVAQLCVRSAGGELYVMLTPDQLAKGAAKAPNGLAWEDLISDFNALGGGVSPPPAPAPPPDPNPPSPPVPPPPAPVPGPVALGLDAVVALLQANWPQGS